MTENPKRQQRCGLCKHVGHNRRSCPQGEFAGGVPVPVPEEIQHAIDYDDISIAEALETKRTELATSNKKIDMGREIAACKRDLEIKQRTYNNDDNSLWYRNQEATTMEIADYIIEVSNEGRPVNHILVTAEPGVGKTAFINHMSFYFSSISAVSEATPYRPIEHQFLITGLSSKDYKPDVDPQLTFINSNNIYHLNDMHKLRSLIVTEPTRIVNAIIYIDEARLVVGKGQTIDKMLTGLGLNDNVIRKYNILFIYIDATPDSLPLVLDSRFNDNISPVFNIEPGDGYKGWQVFDNTDSRGVPQHHPLGIGDPKIRLHNTGNRGDTYGYYEKNDIRTELGRQYICNFIKSTGRNAVMRIVNPGVRNLFIRCLREVHNIRCVIKDSQQPWPDDLPPFEEAIRTLHPDGPIVYIIIRMYTCSKRLQLHKNIGTLYDTYSDNKYDTQTTQGLVARFFTYESMQDVDVDIFLCLAHVKRARHYYETGELGENYESGTVRNGQLRVSTYHQYTLAKIPTDTERLIADSYTNDGTCFSGNKGHAILTGIAPDVFLDRLYNDTTATRGTIMDYCEIYYTFEDLQNRCRYLSVDSTFTPHCHGNIKYHSYIIALGTKRPTSNFPISYSTFLKKSIAHGPAYCYRVHRFKTDPQDATEPVKFCLRWMKREISGM